MRLLLLPKWDQPCALKVSQWPTLVEMLPATSDFMRVAICEDCRRHRGRPLSEANGFSSLCKYLSRSTRVIVQRVSLFLPSADSLDILEQCDVFYMCGGDPGFGMPSDFWSALSQWHAFCRGGRDCPRPGSSEFIDRMNLLNERVMYNQILFMGSCMGAMTAGETFCRGSWGFARGIKLFDFMQGTSLEYEAGTAAEACDTDIISAQTIKITSGSGVAVHVWQERRIVMQFRTTRLDKGWWHWSDRVSNIYRIQQVAENIARRRDGPYHCEEHGIWYFRLWGAIEFEP